MTDKTFITKRAEKLNNYRQDWYLFANARTGFYHILSFLNFHGTDKILLPSYIGWSSKEGSGVFDPILKSKSRYEFYRMNDNLTIAAEDLINRIDENVKACLLINYFGFADPGYAKICQHLRKKKVIIIEDHAHSLFSYFIGRTCGIYADYSFFQSIRCFPIIMEVW